MLSNRKVLYVYNFTVLLKRKGNTNEQALSRFEFEDEFKKKLVELVLYKNLSAEQTAKKYGLPNTTILINWINNYKRKLEKGAVTLASMEKPGTKDVTLSS